jgi:hypothetical protein
VEQTSGTRTLRIPGHVAADETRVYRMSVSVEGYVGETYNDTVGRHVRKNQRLPTVHSQEFLSAVSAYVDAIERAQDGAGQDTAAKVQGVLTIKKSWAEHLRNLGMSEAQIDELATSR